MGSLLVGGRNNRVCLSKVVLVSFFVLISSQVLAQVQFQNTTNSAGGPYRSGESWGASWGHMDEDVYPDLFLGNHGMLTSLLRNNGNGTFSDSLDIADLEQILSSEPEADVHGGAWADFDNDGDQDLFVARSSIGSRFYLFENNGQGFFEERSGPLGIGGNGSGRMPVLFDYTSDGRLDAAYARSGGESKIFKWGTTKFLEDTTNTGLTGLCNAASSGFASDLFDTGTLNFICLSETTFPYSAFDTSTIPFTDISSSIDTIGTNSDTVLADFNNDLKIDVFALRGLIRPSGVKKISDQRIESWMSVSGAVNYEKAIKFSSTGPITVSVYARNVGQADAVFIGASEYNPASLPVTVDPADPNNWGVAANHNQQAVYIEFDETIQEWSITLSSGGFPQSFAGAYITIDGNGLTTPSITNLHTVDLALEPKFLLNNGSQLVDSSSRGIGAIMCGGIAAADFDNDMDVDLYVTCRTSLENTENRLYLNDGTGLFTLQSGVTGAEGLIGEGIDSGAGTAEVVVTSDYDVDGFMDLLVTNGNRLFPLYAKDGFTAGGPDQLYRNLAGNSNHWMQIDFEGVASNRDGFGAKAIVSAGGISQLREQNGQYHRWSHDHKRLHFGLGINTTADVTIEWPDGTTDVHSSIAVDKLYRAVQGGSMVDITPDANAPTLSLDSQTVTEGDSVTLTASLSAPSNSPISVDYQTIANTAIEGVDYVVSSGTLTFAANETSKPIIFTTLNDTELEPKEKFIVSLFNSAGITITQSTGIVTIEEVGGDVCGEPSYSTAVDRGLFVWRDCGNSDTLFVRSTAGGGSQAIYNGVFNASDQISSLIPFSFEGSDSATLSDSDKQLDFAMSMSNTGQDGFEFSLNSNADLCLMLDDPSLTIFVGSERVPFTSIVNLANVSGICRPKLSIADIWVSEAAGSVDVTVTMSDVSANLVSVTYATSDGSAVDGVDYTGVTGILDFQPNDTSGVISIPILQDSDVESLEDFNVTLSASVEADILDGDALVSIQDDELTACGMPTYSSSTEAGLFVWQDCATDQWFVRTTAGGGTGITYDGSLSSDMFFTGVTTYSFEGSDDYTLSNSDKDLSFYMRMSGAGQDGIDFMLPAGSELCLSLDDPNQIIYVGADKTPFLSTVNLANISGVCVAGLPTLSVSDISISEAAGSVDVSVTMSNASANVVSVTYATSDGSAIDGLDYTAVTGVLDFQPSDTSGVISIPILQDSDVESLEDFTVTLSNSVEADIFDGNAVVSIEDDELTACGQPTYSSATEAGLFIWQDCATDQWYVRTTAGGGSGITYNGSLSSDMAFTSVSTFSFEGIDDYTLSNLDKDLSFLMKMSGSGQDGIDFELPSGSELCLSLDDPNQIIYVGADKTPFLSTVNLANISSVCTAGLPTLSVTDISVSEAAGSVDVTVIMNNVSTNIVSVTYATSDGSAIDGLDYTGVAGTIAFQPNDTSAIISIPILQDSDIEPLEDFSVTLSNPVDADILDGNALVSIEDDELTACGEPTYSSSTDAGFFVWQDCGGTDQWYFRATAGGGVGYTYTGSILADSPIAALTTYSFEGIDNYSFSNSDKDLNFLMKMSYSGVDGMQFTLQPGSSCLDVTLPANASIIVGESNSVIAPPFDLISLGSC